MSAIADVAAKLIAESVVTALGTDVFLSTKAQIPDGDGPYLSILETGGNPPIFTHNSPTTPYRQPSFQIVARASGASAARVMIHDAYAALVGIRNTTIGTTFYLWIRPIQEPFELPQDERKRVRFAFNIDTMHT